MESRAPMKMHYWVRASPSDFTGSLPQPRSGHTAINIGKSKIVVFGGLVDKKFLNDIFVYDIENKFWFQPDCTNGGSDGQVGPCPRAFHIAVAIDCHMFIFGGRSGGKRLGDFWVLDTDIWQWSELTSFGDLPSPRDFAAASAIGIRKIVMYGGWDGKKWLSDVYVLDTISLEWTELSVSGSLPPPRCGHTATMVEKRLLVYGGRGGGGPIMGDLWALKGLIEEENETPGWTQLKLPGQAPSPRCGHTITSGGYYLLLFGGHGTGGWLSRYDIYYNDCVVLDRVSVQWRRLPTSNEPPAARAYHSMTCAGSRYLLFGGFDGKSTFGDLWWLVPEASWLNLRNPLSNFLSSKVVNYLKGSNAKAQNKVLSVIQISGNKDPIAKRLMTSSPKFSSEKKDATMENDNHTADPKENHWKESAISELRKRLEVNVSYSQRDQVLNEVDDKELMELASVLVGENTLINVQAVDVLRAHWKNSSPLSIKLKELSPLLRDYQRLITFHCMENAEAGLRSMEHGLRKGETYRFYHTRNASQLRMDDIPVLLEEYTKLVTDIGIIPS